MEKGVNIETSRQKATNTQAKQQYVVLLYGHFHYTGKSHEQPHNAAENQISH